MPAKTFPRYRGSRFHLAMLHERAAQLFQAAPEPGRPPKRAPRVRGPVEFTIVGVRGEPGSPPPPRDDDDPEFGVA